MPSSTILTNDHFNSEKTQEVYRLFLKAEKYEVGDKVRFFAFRKWVNKRVDEYKELNGLSEFNSVISLGKENYLNYLREYADKQGDVPKGQLNIFDIGVM